MVHKSMKNLENDKRLARRRGWIDPAEHKRALEALPDVASKGETVGVEETAEASEVVPEAPAGIGEG